MCEYNKALKVLMKAPVTDDMIKFLTDTTLKVLPTNSNRSYPTPPGSPTNHKNAKTKLPSLMSFISRLVRHTNVYTSTLLTTVCYLNKLKCILPKDASGLPSTIHRIFLACLILSAKFHNDSSPLNKHWAKYTDGLFSVQDINLMERQLIQLLNWDLRISNDDLILDLRMLLEPIVQDLDRTSKQRRRMQKQIQMQAQYQKKSCAGANTNYAYKIYEHQRNVSICSDLSSATLVSDNNLNDIWKSNDYTTLSTSTSLESLNDDCMNRKSSWNSLESDFNQVLMQHGF